MAQLTRTFAEWIVRLLWLGIVGFGVISLARAQQFPFVQVIAPNGPRGDAVMLQDRRGGMWLAGAEAGAEGLVYFDGSRFFSPIANEYPKIVASDLYEDGEGGIWISSQHGLFRIYNRRIERTFEGGFAFVHMESALPIVVESSPGGPAPGTVQLVRITRTGNRWNREVMLSSLPLVQYRSDRSGHVLFACNGGYCEIEEEQIVRWRPGAALQITHHADVTRARRPAVGAPR